MPAAVGEGFHAKGSCEPGQAGRCSHKRRTLVQWECLFSISRGHLFFSPRPTPSEDLRRPMAKRKAPAAANPVAEKPVSPAEYTVVARRYRPQQFADLVGQEPVAQALE